MQDGRGFFLCPRGQRVGSASNVHEGPRQVGRWSKQDKKWSTQFLNDPLIFELSDVQKCKSWTWIICPDIYHPVMAFDYIPISILAYGGTSRTMSVSKNASINLCQKKVRVHFTNDLLVCTYVQYLDYQYRLKYPATQYFYRFYKIKTISYEYT